MQKRVKKLEKSSFIAQLLSSANRPLYNKERKNLKMAYDRFVKRIQQISKQERYSRLDSLHILAQIRETLAQLLESYKDSDSLQCLLIRSSLSLINFEKQMIYLQLKYPGVRNVHTSRPHSSLKISKRFTNSDLMPCRLWVFSASRTILRPPSCRLRASLRRSAIQVSKIRTTAAGPF